MNGENQSLVTVEPVEFENNWLKFKTSGALSIMSEESVESISNELQRKTRRCQHATSWTWKRWEVDRLCPKISLGQTLRET
jgi:hypothetical protein